MSSSELQCNTDKNERAFLDWIVNLTDEFSNYQSESYTWGSSVFSFFFFFFSFLFTSCLAFTFVFNFTSQDDIVSCGFSSWTLTNTTIFFKLQHNYCVFIFLLLNFNIKCCQLLRSVRWLVENFLHSSEQSFPASCNHQWNLINWNSQTG